MRFILFVLLVTSATALASTHVNISFTQQHSSTGSKTAAELRNDQVQVKEFDSFEQLNNDDKNSRFARIKVDDKKSQIDLSSNQKVVSDTKTNYEPAADYRSGRVQNEERDGYFGSHSQNQQRTFYNANHEVHQTNGQFRNLSPQDKQNMEFERYIQSYHSGPTVETVYESAKPEMQHNLATSTVHEGSQRIVKFERQVALPTKADSVQSPSDIIKPIANHQPGTSSVAASTSSSASSSSLLPSKPGVSVSSTNGNSFKVNLNQKPLPVGKDGFNFDLSYNKPNYNDPTFKYKDGHSDAHFYNQFPPSVEEPHSGYGDYYSNIYNRQQVADSFVPAEQRPVVTKTIQIAQPAIKAKKYEVRHPAIQKEFYDIEERVVIKPAGTVVVELERPSAKILKEETTLPLGHPHPAVAAAYMPNRNSQTFSNIIYRNTGPSSSNHQNNQYIPHQTYSNKNVPDHHSSPYDQASKENIAESNQNKPYIGESHFSAVAADDTPKPQNREIVVLTDGNGNQRQISTDHFTYSRDETDKAPSRPTYSQRNSFAYEDKARAANQVNISPQRSGFQANHDNGEDFDFDAEYINTSGNTNSRKENKPARLQDASSNRVVEQKQQQQPIIKHEHKIVLSPSQHNIFLSRNQEVPKMKFIEEAAEVREIKPYVQNHRGPVVVYAPAKQTSELKYVQRSEYKPPARVSSEVVQYYSSPQRSQLSGADNRVQYSAPYAQMRLHSDEEQNQKVQQRQREELNQRKSGQLIVEEKPVSTDVNKSSMENSMKKQVPQAHIEIKIPNRLSDDGNKAIFVSSTIRPMTMDDDRDQTHNSKLEISVTSNGDPRQEQASKDEVDNSNQTDNGNDNKNGNLSDKDSEYLSNIKTKPDCDQPSKSVVSENYELAREQNSYGQQKFMRIIQNSSTATTTTGNDAISTAESAPVQANIKPQNIDVNVKSTAGHVSPSGSRVLASTAAPKESTPSESFHKRRIVVNHPFQTVREVVEHEPYTNYHEVQVNEPATPALYHSANYYQPHGALRQSENRHSVSPAYYH